MRALETTVDIDAPTDRVWEVSMAFGSYPEWNPFVQEISGEPAEQFSGLLVPLLWRMVNTDTRAGFEEMNAALKSRVEGTS
jgi:hypothetical protein